MLNPTQISLIAEFNKTLADLKDGDSILLTEVLNHPIVSKNLTRDEIIDVMYKIVSCNPVVYFDAGVTKLVKCEGTPDSTLRKS